jgi:RNA polymerase sigma-70 factor (sigma-E family)
MSDHDASYVEFVTAHQARLRRIAYAVCRDDNRAEDVLQEAFVKLFLAWSKVRKQGVEEAYARRIIVNADIDDRRRPWRRHRAASSDEHLARLPATAPLALEDRSELLEALRRLPAMQRRTVVLRHLVGLSVRETAVELAIGEGTVKSHTSRGLATLRESLGEPAGLPLA